ncbi:hypothetical protein FYX41_00750 [Salmonella enterica subsp. enterica]|nr:hypothetical protein [Salmonella enterica subsp. enterica serovar Malstatt]
MPIENATVISELNPDWPVGKSDFVSQGDDQLRMLKKVLQNTIPNANAAITGTPDQLNNLTGGLNFVEGGDEIQPYWQLANPDGGSAVVLATAPMTLEGIKSGGEFALTLTTLHDVIFAVGSQYVNYIDSRNPVDILGFGTWESVVGLIAGVGAATDYQGYTQNYSVGYQPGFWRVQNGHIVEQTFNLDGGATNTDGGHQHGHETANSYWGDSGHVALMAGDGEDQGGSAGDHSHTVTGTVTIGMGGAAEESAFYNPYYGAYIWKRTA